MSFLLLCSCVARAQPTPADKYELLVGDGLAGSAFVIKIDERLWGVSSVHQYAGNVPKRLNSLDLESELELDGDSRFVQRDVQALAIKSPKPSLTYLDYEPVFELKPNDELIVLDDDGGVHAATLQANRLDGEVYYSASGYKRLSAKMVNPFAAGGGSGGPVILKRTGAVIGVLLSADNPTTATVIEFETLCLGRMLEQLNITRTGIAGAIKPLAIRLPLPEGTAAKAIVYAEKDFPGLFPCIDADEALELAKLTRQVVSHMGGNSSGGGSLAIYEFNNDQVAASLPMKMARAMESYMKENNRNAQGPTITIKDFPDVVADTAVSFQVTGQDGRGQSQIVRAARGRFMAEITLFKLVLSETETAKLLNESLDVAIHAANPSATQPVK